jgi:heparan-sulfate lyase
MPDAGSYIYSGDPENRAWFRQTKVHQTLTLNGENSTYAPSLLLWKPGNDLDILVVENGSYDNLTHRRAVFFVDKRYFVIIDEAIGEGVGDIGLHFQLAPSEAYFDYKKLTVNTGFTEGWNVMVKTNKQKGLKLIEEEGQVSFEYTKKMPRPAFAYHMDNVSNQKGIRFITLVAPYEMEKPHLKIKLLGKPNIGASTIQLEIKENGNKKAIGYTLSTYK